MPQPLHPQRKNPKYPPNIGPAPVSTSGRKSLALVPSLRVHSLLIILTWLTNGYFLLCTSIINHVATFQQTKYFVHYRNRKEINFPSYKQISGKNNKADVPLTRHSHWYIPCQHKCTNALFQFFFLILTIIIYFSFHIICFNIIIFSKLDVQ